jgi:putative transposase
MSCSRRSTARSCCLGKSGGTSAEVIGYLKGKSSIWIAQNVERKLRNFLGHKFWARGYFVSTVGRDQETIRAYIRNQEMADKQLDQLQLKLASS